MNNIQVFDIPATGEIVLPADNRKVYVLRGAFPVDVDVGFVDGISPMLYSYICCINTSNRDNEYFVHSENSYAEGGAVIMKTRITLFHYSSPDPVFTAMPITDPLLEALYYALFV
ncbi:MAG: hypothetical protein LBK02_00690 [Treponema sp.]|jgi:hypothetical protein|nr:hypothetical protein [Treponema sp.]